MLPPELKVRTPAHAEQLGWHVEFEFRVTQTWVIQVPRPAGGHMWTIVQHDGPNHLELWVNQVRDLVASGNDGSFYRARKRLR